MKSLSHWGMFHCWEAPGLAPMAEQPKSLTPMPLGGWPWDTPKSWVHQPIGNPYPITNFTLAEALRAPHEDDLKLTIVNEARPGGG